MFTLAAQASIYYRTALVLSGSEHVPVGESELHLDIYDRENMAHLPYHRTSTTNAVFKSSTDGAQHAMYGEVAVYTRFTLPVLQTWLNVFQRITQPMKTYGVIVNILCSDWLATG